MALAPERQKDILAALGFSVIEQGGRWQVSVPSWRRDMDGAPDVVEEVTRITGFDAIASVPLPRADGVAKPTATPEQLIERRLRRAAASAGFDEAGRAEKRRVGKECVSTGRSRGVRYH